jgi:hypothetical protein
MDDPIGRFSEGPETDQPHLTPQLFLYRRRVCYVNIKLWENSSDFEQPQNLGGFCDNQLMCKPFHPLGTQHFSNKKHE